MALQDQLVAAAGTLSDLVAALTNTGDINPNAANQLSPQVANVYNLAVQVAVQDSDPTPPPPAPIP
jgi:hypothetical protein